MHGVVSLCLLLGPDAAAAAAAAAHHVSYYYLSLKSPEMAARLSW